MCWSCGENQLFNFGLDNMAWKARWLEQELALDTYQVKRVLTRCPSVFAYSAERNLVRNPVFLLLHRRFVNCCA